MSYRSFTFTFASAATSTNKQYVGPHERCFIVASAMTNFNAGSGNATLNLKGGLSATDVHATVQSCTIATHTIKGIYPMPYPGLPFMSIEFGTAVTGAATNTIDVIVYSKSDDI